MKFLVIFVLLLINTFKSIALDPSKDVEGKDCSVTESIGNYTFNFAGLASEFNYHINGNDENMGHYSFNICRMLSKKCNNETAAACLKTLDGREIVIGYDSKLFWNDGQIRFSYAGQKCNNEKNYTLNVILHCDYAETKNDFLGVFHDDNECEVNILMRTPKACFEIPDNVKNAKMYVTTPKNQTLNFSALKSANHIINAPKDGTFIIGFPIAYEYGALCAAGSTVCHVDNKEKDLSKKYTNLGMMTSNIEFEDDRPVIKLTSKEKCGGDGQFGSSKIIFECDQLKGEGTPKFKGTKDCVNTFVWETNLACPMEDQSCVVSGPNGELYDFSSLAGVQYEAAHPNKTDEKIFFSICSPSKECGDGKWGGCIVKNGANGNKQTTTVGNFNRKLQVENKNVFLKYEDGARCGSTPGMKYSTKIEFNVADDEKDEVTVLVEDNCEIVIHFKTLLANQNVKNCVVKDRNDQEIDLRPLINFEGNYEAKINETSLPSEASSNATYLLNVCRPINSFYSLNCHGNTGACRTVMKNGKHEDEISLGHFEHFMSTEKGRIENTPDVIMKYFHGSKCPHDTEEEIATSVRFQCDESAGIGTPILQSISNCEYKFDFPTSVLCKDKVVKLKSNDSCVLTNGDASVNLKSYGVFNTKNRTVDVCDTYLKTYTINFKQSMVVIEYADKDFVDIEVQLKCNSKNNTFIDVSNEAIVIMNESTIVCPLFNIVPKMTLSSEDVSESQPITDHTDESASTSKFSLGYLFLVGILFAAFGVFYIVIRNPERREIIRNMIKFRSRTNIRYTRNMNDDDLILS